MGVFRVDESLGSSNRKNNHIRYERSKLDRLLFRQVQPIKKDGTGTKGYEYLGSMIYNWQNGELNLEQVQFADGVIKSASGGQEVNYPARRSVFRYAEQELHYKYSGVGRRKNHQIRENIKPINR